MMHAALALMLTFGLATESPAWWHVSHDVITRAAVRATPEVPAFFKDGAGMIAHMVADPDLLRNDAIPLAKGIESPEHFIDLELMEGRELPVDRFAFIAMCNELGVALDDVGFIPFAVAEATERLILAFAEHRKLPENPYIKSKCLVIAGQVAHYAQDMSQPLHLTVRHHGYRDEKGVVQQADVHAKVDGLPFALKLTVDQISNGLTIEPIDSLMAGVIAQVKRGFALVDRVYELGRAMPTPPSSAEEEISWKRDRRVEAFALERTREAARFTAALYLTAWRKSANLKLPSFYTRSFDQN